MKLIKPGLARAVDLPDNAQKFIEYTTDKGNE